VRYIPNKKGDGVRFAKERANPRVIKLVPLYRRLEQYENYGATKKELRELAAELRAVKAFASAARCDRIAGSV